MVEHADLEDTKIRRITSAPASAPSFVGEMIVEDNVDTSIGRCLRMADGTASASDFVVVAFVPQAYSGDPNGSVTARCDRDLCIDTSGYALYYASSEGSTSWNVLTGSGGGGGS